MATVIGNPNTMSRLVAPAGSSGTVQPQSQSQQTQTGGPDLNDFTYFNNRSYGGIQQEEVDSARGQNALAAVRKYDPNAQYTAVHNSDGNLIGYQMQYDPSKLPGSGVKSYDNGGNLGGANPYNNGYSGGSGFMPRFSTVQQHMNLTNPNAVMNSNNYGKITDNRNIYDKQDWISKYGPAIIGAIGMFGGLGPLGSMLMKAPQTIAGMTQGGFNPFQLASMAVPFIPGIGNVPFLSSAARMGINYVGSQRRGG